MPACRSGPHAKARVGNGAVEAGRGSGARSARAARGRMARDRRRRGRAELAAGTHQGRHSGRHHALECVEPSAELSGRPRASRRRRAAAARRRGTAAVSRGPHRGASRVAAAHAAGAPRAAPHASGPRRRRRAKRSNASGATWRNGNRLAAAPGGASAPAAGRWPWPAAGGFCAACAAARAQERAAATARVLFEAPWLGFNGTSALVDGLREEEYEHIRTGLLKHWWGTLAQARATKRLSRDGRERLVASSYVLLQSKLPPEEIRPATVRSILGDELHDLLYGEPPVEGGAVKDRKRRT